VSWASISSAQGTLGKAIRTRKAAVRNDIQVELPGGKLRQEALNKGCRSTVCLPLVVDDNVVALIVLFATGRGFFDSDELALLSELAADVSFALQSIARQEKVQYLSYYDVLTGLPNRQLFIARIGADGFGVVIRGIRDAAAVVHTVENQALGCFEEPFKLNGSELRVAARAGIALYPADGGDADTLFKNAEAALKKAGDSGERYLFYAAEMNARAAHALSLESRLRKAVAARQFVLHYQPKIELANDAICGFEALIRWQDPETGLVPPGAFIPMLEETGLILEVGLWALGQALADHREWTARGSAVPRIAVNVSAIQLQQRDFTDLVTNVAQQDGNAAEALELEITESLLMKDVESSIRKLSILRELGIHIALDDFGTGYSSLGCIARLPISSVKIDRSFISGVARSAQDMAIVTTIIALARSLNLRVVAEGVETADQSKLLKLLRCDEAQGFLFSKPLAAAEIEQLLLASAQ